MLSLIPEVSVEVVQAVWSSINDDLGLSEKRVPLNPMVLLIIIPMKNGYNWEYTLGPIFRQTHLVCGLMVIFDGDF